MRDARPRPRTGASSVYGARRPAGPASPTNTATGERTMKTATKAKAKKTTTITKAKGTAKPKADAKPKRASALDAAAQVLKDAGEPMQVRAMVEQMRAKGLWSSDAATPWATLYSAIIREVKTR